MSSIHKNIKITFSNIHKTILFCGLFISIVLFFNVITENLSFAQTSEVEVDQEENDKLISEKREEIDEIEEKIKGFEAEIKAQQSKERTLKREIALYNNNIYKNELEIKQTKLSIEEAGIELEEIEKKIKEGEEKITRDRENLKNLIRLLYTYQQDSLLEILIFEDDISDFFNKVDAAESLKNEVFTTIIDLKNEKKELESKDKELHEQREGMGQLIQIRSGQNDSIAVLKVQKNELLEVTRGEEAQFNQLLEENKSILPSLKAQLYDLQSLGNKIKFEDAFSAAKHIGSVIGVRPAFLLGILKVESNLGKNTGSGTFENDMYGCYMRLSKIYSYREAHYIKRAEDEKRAFYSIIDKLGLDPNSVKVSREPTYGCGGAMGPAQFIPTTWAAYEQRVSDVIGHYPPNPWNLADAMAAMAVKVSDIPGVVGGDYKAEYEAAGRYLGGRNWRSKNLFFYPNQVMLFADLYEEDMR